MTARHEKHSQGWWRFKATQEGQRQVRGLTDWPVGTGATFEREVLPVGDATPTSPIPILGPTVRP